MCHRMTKCSLKFCAECSSEKSRARHVVHKNDTNDIRCLALFSFWNLFIVRCCLFLSVFGLHGHSQNCYCNYIHSSLVLRMSVNATSHV
jgi:hypothetical protein